MDPHVDEPWVIRPTHYGYFHIMYPNSLYPTCIPRERSLNHTRPQGFTTFHNREISRSFSSAAHTSPRPSLNYLYIDFNNLFSSRVPAKQATDVTCGYLHVTSRESNGLGDRCNFSSKSDGIF